MSTNDQNFINRIDQEKSGLIARFFFQVSSTQSIEYGTTN
ncbi:hypothetical protein AQPE_3071 [Aquipluma nitroreducens]|uniref:Uncharacterized protein n=1 Tax=Aquipluma nitroreducens TaxID=2010828 RepID=A0A5K7SBE3_9BACT|nr:hypothetical protein AQPE_3071 [Aquipluma nitroreducens]